MLGLSLESLYKPLEAKELDMILLLVVGGASALTATPPRSNAYQRPVSSLKPMTAKEIRATVISKVEFWANPTACPVVPARNFAEDRLFIYGDPPSRYPWTVLGNRLCFAKGYCDRYYKNTRGNVFLASDTCRGSEIAREVTYVPVEESEKLRCAPRN